MYIDSATARSELDELLRQCGCGDNVAFSELYRRSSRKLFGLCLSILRERSDAEEVLQDSYVLIWRRSRIFDARKGSAITWLIAITRNKAIDKLRRRSTNLPTAIHYQEQEADLESSPVVQAETEQAARNLQCCLSQLKPEHELSIREAFFKGSTYRDIALRRNVPEGTMKAQIRRSLRALKISLSRRERLEPAKR